MDLRRAEEDLPCRLDRECADNRWDTSVSRAARLAPGRRRPRLALVRHERHDRGSHRADPQPLREIAGPGYQGEAGTFLSGAFADHAPLDGNPSRTRGGLEAQLPALARIFERLVPI